VFTLTVSSSAYAVLGTVYRRSTINSPPSSQPPTPAILNLLITHKLRLKFPQYFVREQWTEGGGEVLYERTHQSQSAGVATLPRVRSIQFYTTGSFKLFKVQWVTSTPNTVILIVRDRHAKWYVRFKMWGNKSTAPPWPVRETGRSLLNSFHSHNCILFVMSTKWTHMQCFFVSIWWDFRDFWPAWQILVKCGTGDFMLFIPCVFPQLIHNPKYELNKM
jgi:hypothetical protein